jgi:predicted nucleotidyltransferase
VSEQLALAVDPPNEVEQLSVRLGVEWPAIAEARASAEDTLQRLRGAIEDFLPEGTSFVAFGSLARREFTRGSDVDWTLLVDTAADPAHQLAVPEIRRRLARLRLDDPNPAGSFGRLTFGHDLIHRIGGDDDTNRNTTQRILLLLESASIGNPDVHARVVRSVLRRYIEEDLRGADDSPFRVPRFLLNDIVRYWRTIAVDFAQKRRERGGSGWALRTAKLRMARKLMYAAGLLNCFSCEYALAAEPGVDPLTATERVVGDLAQLVRKTPLDIMARTVLLFGELSVPGRELFGAYDAFLRLMDDEAARHHLEALRPELAANDAVYDEVRVMGQRFQQALATIFFESATPLPELTKRYGVF